MLALLEMLHMWFVVLENPNTVIRKVFLDFSKAFDLIDHNILLKQYFKDVGVHPALLPWLASYLSDRTQRVKFEGELSNFREVNAMLQFYSSVIRSSLEYGDVLWHGSPTNAQSVDLERIQKRALRIICPKKDYNESLAHFRMSIL